MNEGLLSRIGRLVSASANSLVDSLENTAPAMVMEQAMREIDQAIDDVRQQLGKVEASRYLSSKSLARQNQRHDELDAQINVAVKEARDDLAEAAIAKQMDIEAQIPVIEKALAEDDSNIAELNGYIEALQAKKREMQEALTEFRQATVADDPAATQAASRQVNSDVEKATEAFDRVLRKAGGAGVGETDNAKLVELENLARSNRIKERLAKVKSRT